MLPRSRTTIVAASSFLVLALAARAQNAPLTVETIFAHGSLTGTPPEHLSWSPDGRHLTFEQDGELVDLSPGQPDGKPRVLVSRAKLAAIEGAKDSEQDRDHRDRYHMADYLWSPDSRHLLFDSKGRLWYYDLETGTGVEVGYTGEASGDDPKFSPDGQSISFLRNHSLTVLRLKSPEVPAITVAASTEATQLNGEVDWVYEEELDVRSNYFWAPDSKHLAFLQMNEKDVPEYPIADWIPTHATVDNQRYPQPGDHNPEVRVGVVSAWGGGKMTWIRLPMQPGQDYIPRFGWADARTVWVEVLTRDHKHRNLYFADAATGVAQPALQLTDDKFFDEKYDVLVGEGSLVINQWSDGHNHLYLYGYDKAHPGAATLLRQLTQGDFEVDEAYGLDPASKTVVYASSEGNPLGQQIWQVDFEGKRRQLSSGAGRHEGIFAPQGNAFVDKFSSHLTPPAEQLCAADKCSVFWQSKSVESFHLRAPQTLTVRAADGTTLYATLLLPEGATAAASVPLILNPYGGPGSQTVTDGWQSNLFFDTVLAQHGFAVLHADNRGMGNRGRTFQQAAYHDFGPVQLQDQLTVLDAVLAQNPQLDPKRLGWWGWSWGGTFTLYAMSHSDRFRAGVAVAPVTDWKNYDSVYTERYMSQPAEFSSGYRDFSVVNSAANLKGHLLLVHGTGDDNVHMENSIQYVQRLIEAQKPYDLQLYPRKTHSIAGPDVRTHLYNRILAQFEQYLK